MEQNQELLKNLTPDEDKLLQQSINQENERALQEGIPTGTVQHIRPHFPPWPTSKPGPEVTPPPPGERPVNDLRTDQMLVMGYNPETGRQGTAQPESATFDEALMEDLGMLKESPKRHK